MKRLHQRAGAAGMALGAWLACGAVAAYALPPVLGGAGGGASGAAAAAGSGAADAATSVGATLQGNSVTFRLWAPEARSVAVWSEATGTKPHPMQPEAGRPGYWSFTTRAHAGTAYNFHADGHIHRDPRARAVDADRNLSYVADPAAYKWAATEATWKMPPKEDLVMYELHPSTFAAGIPGHDAPLDKAIKRIPYLKGLGINCVQLMPVNEFPGDRSWGYNPSDLYAVESSYGGGDALRRFVEACHANGIAVLLDVVHNHYGPDNIAMWDLTGRGGWPYFYTDPERGSTEWGPRPDFGNPEVRAFIADSIRMWIREYHLDGFRWDSVHNIRYYQAGSGYNADGDRLLSDVNAWLAKNAPNALRIAEDHAFDYGGVGFQAQWHSAFQTTLSGLVRAGPASRDLENLAGELEAQSWEWVNFAECHDSAGDLNMHHRLPMYIDPSNPDSTRARSLALLANCIVMTIPGYPMFLQGFELHDTPDFSDGVPLPWSKAKSNAGILKATADIIKLRRNAQGWTEGLKGETLRVVHCDNEAKVIAWSRTKKSASKDSATVVVVNFSDKPLKQYGVKFPSSGAWFCHYNSGLASYDPNFDNVGLKPGEGLQLPAGQTTMPLDLSRDSIMVFSKVRPPNATLAKAPPAAEVAERVSATSLADDDMRVEEKEWKEETIPPFPYKFVPLPEELFPAGAGAAAP